MKLVFLGYNDVGLEIYEWLCDRESVDVLALTTTPDQLPLIERLEPDIVVSVGFDHLVPDRYLNVPDRGCVNLHPAYLPYNRGKSPNVWSITEGTPAGVTLHYMDAEFDTGDIIERRRVEKSFADTGRKLYERLEDAQFELFTEVWPEIEAGTVEAKPQPNDLAGATSHTTDDFRDLCEIDPYETVTVREIIDRLRALTFQPFDNAYLEVDSERYYVDVDIRPEEERETDRSRGTITEY